MSNAYFDDPPEVKKKAQDVSDWYVGNGTLTKRFDHVIDRETRQDIEQSSGFDQSSHAWPPQPPARATSSSDSDSNSDLQEYAPYEYQDDNGLNRSKPIDIPRPKPKPKPMEQSRLEYGQETFIRCNGCMTHYNTVDEDDRKYHARIHKAWEESRKIINGPPGKLLKSEVVNGQFHEIYFYDKTTSPKWKEEDALAVLRLSLEDLGGMSIEELRKIIWQKITNPNDPSDPRPVYRFKIYHYRIWGETVGVLLAERISEGGAYYKGWMTHDEFGPWPSIVRPPEMQEYVSRDETYPVFMSIDRIWVHRDHRRVGIATALADEAREHFVQGMPLSKKQIAFSRPTEMGYEFARKYCGEEFDETYFLVNTADGNGPFVEDDKLVSGSADMLYE